MQNRQRQAEQTCNEQLGKLIADALMLKGGGTAVLPVRLLASGTGLEYNTQR